MNVRKKIGVLAFVMAPLVLAGCASNEELQSIRDGMGALKQDVQKAQSTADSAQASADAAAQRAEEAAAEARRAAAAAEAAAARAQAAADKADRMFREQLKK